jgi:hypothetical protein
MGKASTLLMDTNTRKPDVPPSPDWAPRELYWRRRLGRIRLGVEPIEEQLARQRKVTWGLTAVPLVIAALFLGLFAAFRAVLVGAVVVGVLLLPIVAFAWLGDWSLRRRVAAYERERRSFGERPEQGRP